jgi:hypothetical protein
MLGRITQESPTPIRGWLWPYVNDDVRFTINGIAIGEASTGKTVLGLELCRSLPKCAFVDASLSTEVTLTLAYDSTLKEMVLGPMALLDGDAYDFGVVVINEAQNLKELSCFDRQLRNKEPRLTKVHSTLA